MKDHLLSNESTYLDLMLSLVLKSLEHFPGSKPNWIDLRRILGRPVKDCFLRRENCSKWCPGLLGWWPQLSYSLTHLNLGEAKLQEVWEPLHNKIKTESWFTWHLPFAHISWSWGPHEVPSIAFSVTSIGWSFPFGEQNKAQGFSIWKK